MSARYCAYASGTGTAWYRFAGRVVAAVDQTGELTLLHFGAAWVGGKPAHVASLLAWATHDLKCNANALH